ncbi:MAG: glutamate ABC transporter substrate-binding protein [Actinoallomurus sp.]
MRLRRIGLAVTLLLASAGCGVAGGATASVSGKDHLVVGVAKDQPGLGVRDANGTYKGFDVDVAREIARRLGIKQVTFKSVSSGEREAALRNGAVDMVVKSYSITQQRKTQVVFAGPYYVAHQDILVRGGETTVRNVRDLRGKRLCQVTGSVSWQRVTEERKINARLVPASTYGECLDDLIADKVDAISTDDLILAGFAAQRGNQVRFVNAPFSDERYGVGLSPGDIRGCEDVNKAITEMYQDGTAATLLHRWFGSTSLNVTTTVPQFEGCG